MTTLPPPAARGEGEGEWWGEEEVLSTLQDYAVCSGLLLPSGTPLPLSVTPAAFPQDLYHLARSVQKDVNTVIDAVSRDCAFMKEALQSVLKTDEFHRRLFDIYDQTYSDNVQSCTLGLCRADYMLDYSPSSGELSLKQIETNTIAVSFFGLNQERVERFHRFVHARYSSSSGQLNAPPLPTTTGVDAIATACKLYRGSQGSCVLLVVPAGGRETSVFDQRFLEFDLWDRYGIPLIRKTLAQLHHEARLGPHRELLVCGQEVGVVIHRTGYVPELFANEDEWSVRLLLERSLASSCPSMGHQLAGSKKIQQVLATPGTLERFLCDPVACQRLRSTFAGLYSLKMDAEGDRAVEMALREPERFVLKPQREGGGSNYFGAEVLSLLQRVGASPEREAFILMDRLRPPPQPGRLLWPEGTLQATPVVSELGIMGVYVRQGDVVHMNSDAGSILRSKALQTHEGGVFHGSGALDTPNLTPDHSFIELHCHKTTM